jgi:uncharacterized protein with von Willebrand factor type A (vWA) domain
VTLRTLLHQLGLFLMFAASLLPLEGCRTKTPPPASETATTEKVGTYRRYDLLVAYYASDVVHQRLADMRQRRDAALAAGHTATAEALEREGEAMQEKAHRQLAGDEPLDNILADLKDAIPQVERELGVSRLVEDTTKLPKGVARVDATEALTKHLPRSPLLPANPRPRGG